MNRPEIIEGPNIIKGNPESTDKKELIGTMVEVLMKSLFTVLPMVQNYYRQATRENFGAFIDLDHSFIRLNNVTGFKYGDGARVKTIDIIAHNIHNAVDTFGTVYDYTTTDSAGNKISSGVATYEPLIGGDENALKHALFYSNRVAMRNYIPTFSELPVNENYYPAPSVGYGKVTVRSRASDLVVKELLPASIPTTGQTVQEFYTTKDFPTIIKYTPLEAGGLNIAGNMLHYHHHYPIPIIGNFTNEQLSISQGFSAELNDMNGMEKANYSYAQNTEGKIIDSTPLSYQKSIYKAVNYSLDGYIVQKLVNEADVMYSDDNIQHSLLGLDYEYFGDTRETESKSTTFGMRINADIFTAGFVPFGLLSLLPTIGEDVKGVRLATTNKIIHRVGILDSIIQFNEGSLAQTSNLLYDANTGTPLLTKVNDEFGDSTFNYTIPAYWQYDGMGLSYLNSNFSFNAKVDSQHIDTKYIGLKVNQPSILEYLTNGDQIAINNGDNNYSTGYIIQVNPNYYTIWVDTKAMYGFELTQGEKYNCVIIKPGRKNMLTIPAGTIISKANPVTNRINYECK
jgi:hypothetical protein